MGGQATVWHAECLGHPGRHYQSIPALTVVLQSLRVHPNWASWSRLGGLEAQGGQCLDEPGSFPPSSHQSLLSPGTGVTANALHPGVARTELGRHTGMHNSAFSSLTLGEFPHPSA